MIFKDFLSKLAAYEYVEIFRGTEVSRGFRNDFQFSSMYKKYKDLEIEAISVVPDGVRGIRIVLPSDEILEY